MKDKTFIFLGGLHRSGTSLLHQILQGHPLISGFKDTGVPEDEGQHLQSVYPAAMAFGGAGRFGFDPRSHMDETHPLATPDNAQKLFGEWRPYWDSQSPYYIEKSPPNLVRTRFLQELFSDTVFVIIFRHPIAVSYATRKWCQTRIKELMAHTLTCYERFMADLPYLRRCLVLRYEDFVRRPQETLDEIYGFIGIEPVAVTETVRQDVNGKYLEMWRKENAHLKRRLFHRLPFGWEKRVRKLGYSIRTPEALQPADFLGRHERHTRGAADPGASPAMARR